MFIVVLSRTCMSGLTVTNSDMSFWKQVPGYIFSLFNLEVMLNTDWNDFVWSFKWHPQRLKDHNGFSAGVVHVTDHACHVKIQPCHYIGGVHQHCWCESYPTVHANSPLDSLPERAELYLAQGQHESAKATTEMQCVYTKISNEMLNSKQSGRDWLLENGVLCLSPAFSHKSSTIVFKSFDKQLTFRWLFSVFVSRFIYPDSSLRKCHCLFFNCLHGLLKKIPS